MEGHRGINQARHLEIPGQAMKPTPSNWRRKLGRTNLLYLWNETYTAGVLVAWPCDDAALKAVAKKYMPCVKDPAMGNASGWTYYDEDGNNTLIVLHEHLFNSRRRELVPVLAHEAVHFITNLFDDIGVGINRDNDEPTAYLMSWFMRNAYPAVIGGGK